MISPTVSQDRNFTPFFPKYSLITSVMMNTTGQSKTPADSCKEHSEPKIFQFKGSIPMVSSKEKIFEPMNSATRALATKNPAKIRNNRVDLSDKMFVIINVKNLGRLTKCKNNFYLTDNQLITQQLALYLNSKLHYLTNTIQILKALSRLRIKK